MYDFTESDEITEQDSWPTCLRKDWIFKKKKKKSTVRATISLWNEIVVIERSGGACSFNPVSHNKRAFKQLLPVATFLAMLELES